MEWSMVMSVSHNNAILFQIVEEAGGKVTRMDGGAFTVFDRSVIVSNGAIHDKVRLFPVAFSLNRRLGSFEKIINQQRTHKSNLRGILIGLKA